MFQSVDLPHRNLLMDNLIYSHPFLLVKSVGLLLSACFFLDHLDSFYEIESHHEFFVACFDLENTFDEIICFKDEGLLNSDCLGMSIVTESLSHFNIFLKPKIINDLFVSNLGNFRGSSCCKKVIHKHFING